MQQRTFYSKVGADIYVRRLVLSPGARIAARTECGRVDGRALQGTAGRIKDEGNENRWRGSQTYKGA